MIVTASNARDLTLKLLAARAPEATLCPSEVARAVVTSFGAKAAVDWRSAMPKVHAAVDGLLAEGRVRLSWKGERLETRKGPYRISRGQNS